MNLPLMPRLQGKQTSPFVRVGDEDSTVQWESGTFATTDLSSGDPYAASFRK